MLTYISNVNEINTIAVTPLLTPLLVKLNDKTFVVQLCIHQIIQPNIRREIAREHTGEKIVL